MEQKTYELPFQERCLLPVNESAVPLLITLDSLALDVMIIDEQTKICFINSHYLQSYGEYWEKIGIPAKQIPGTVLLQMKNPDMAALDRLLNLIRNSLASDNYYYEDFGFSGLSDVVRIDTPSFKGAAVIQTHNDLISELSVSVAYYKDLYKQAQQQLQRKTAVSFSADCRDFPSVCQNPASGRTGSANRQFRLHFRRKRNRKRSAGRSHTLQQPIRFRSFYPRKLRRYSGKPYGKRIIRL